MDNLTQEAKQLAKGVNINTKHKLNSNKGVIPNKLEELKRLNKKSWIYQCMKRKLQILVRNLKLRLEKPIHI